MVNKDTERTKAFLLLILIFLSLAGFLVHYRAHPIFIEPIPKSGIFQFSFSNFLASLLSLIDLFIVTPLFLFRKTVIYAFLLNGLIIIYGIILMAHFSVFIIIKKNWPINLESIFIFSTFPQIITSLADFLAGKILYDWYMKKS